MISKLLALSFVRPGVLWFSPLAILPFLVSPRSITIWPWLGAVPRDRMSELMDLLLKILGSLAILGIVFGVAGVYRVGGTVTKVGTGAHIVLLIDYSSSMSDGFAGTRTDGEEESKATAAKRLLQGFVKHRPNDHIGVVAFSTMPLQVLPLSNSPESVEAAISAIDRTELTYTDIGRGLAMAFSMFDKEHDPLTSKAVILVSDGAGVIDRQVQDKLRTALEARPVNIYWLFLRTAGHLGIYDDPPPSVRDTPQSMPERHLDLFFKSLDVPYQAFEAESVEEVAQALEELDALEQSPLVYTEEIPRSDLAVIAYSVSLISTLLLLLSLLIERQIGPIVRR